MMSAMRRFPGLFAGVALLASPACSTQEITRPHTATGLMPAADRGELTIWYTPPDYTIEDQQARATRSPDSTQYHVFVDGAQLIWDWEVEGIRDPVIVVEGGGAGAGYLTAGPHLFEIKVAGGGRTVFAGEGEIPPASTNRLYLFGDRGALQGRLVSFPTEPPSGTLHVSVINLIRRGPGIEVVTCADGASCVPLSAPLALGDVFEADFPAAGSTGATRYQLASGASIGCRQIATDVVPATPVYMLVPSHVAMDVNGVYPPNFVFAPVFMSPQGDVFSYSN